MPSGVAAEPLPNLVKPLVGELVHGLQSPAGMSFFKNRRAHRRVPVEVEISLEPERNFHIVDPLGPSTNVVLEIDAESDHNFYTGLTNDISEGGVFIATTTMLPVGKNVVMSIQLPPAPEAQRVEGEVRWIREPEACFGGAVPGYGVAFRDVAPEVLATLRAYIARHETIFFEAA